MYIFTWTIATTHDQKAKWDWNQFTLTKNQNLNFKTEIQRNPNDWLKCKTRPKTPVYQSKGEGDGNKEKGKKRGGFPPSPSPFCASLSLSPSKTWWRPRISILSNVKLPYVSPPPPKGRFPGCFTWAIPGELPREALIPLLVLIVIGSNWILQ